jgi:hypothetical protein
MNDPPMPRDRFSAITDALAAIVLSIAALLTSWASFQAALWDGEQASAYTRAGQARVQASLLATENGQYQAGDLFLFIQWLNAYAGQDRLLQDFYLKRFRPEFRRAFDAWAIRRPMQNSQAPNSPFVMPEYRPDLARQAQAADRHADQLFEQGQRCNDISDSYVGATVVLALALFLGGIGQTFKRPHLTAGLTVLAALACVFGFVRLIALPALPLG